MNVLYLGFTKGNRHLTLKNNLAYCLANAIKLDDIIIEDISRLDFKQLLNLKQNIKNISILFVNDYKDFAPNEIMAKTAFNEFSQVTSIVEISKEDEHHFPKLILSANSLLTQYAKALETLNKTNENVHSANNLLGFRSQGDKIIIHEQEIKSVRVIFKLRIIDGRNLHQIKVFCDRYNIRQPNNLKVTVKYLNKMFAKYNCYMGLDKLPNGKIMKNLWPRILTNEIYYIYYIEKWDLIKKDWQDGLKQFKAKKSFKDFDWSKI